MSLRRMKEFEEFSFGYVWISMVVIVHHSGSVQLDVSWIWGEAQ